MKRKEIIIYVLLVIVIGWCGLVKLNRNVYNIWSANSIEVMADAPLIVDKVKIEFGKDAHVNCRTDSDLFKNRERYIVLFDGMKKNELISDYGENDFLITYNNDQYYFPFQHFILNRSHQHDYYFHFFQKENQILVRVDIKGRNARIVEGQMRGIKELENRPN